MWVDQHTSTHILPIIGAETFTTVYNCSYLKHLNHFCHQHANIIYFFLCVGFSSQEFSLIVLFERVSSRFVQILILTKPFDIRHFCYIVMSRSLMAKNPTRRKINILAISHCLLVISPFLLVFPSFYYSFAGYSEDRCWLFSPTFQSTVLNAPTGQMSLAISSKTWKGDE